MQLLFGELDLDGAEYHGAHAHVRVRELTFVPPGILRPLLTFPGFEWQYRCCEGNHRDNVEDTTVMASSIQESNKGDRNHINRAFHRHGQHKATRCSPSKE